MKGELIMELVNGMVVTLEELQENEEMECVTNVEDCGMSGRIIGGHLYNVICEDGEEYEVVVK